MGGHTTRNPHLPSHVNRRINLSGKQKRLMMQQKRSQRAASNSARREEEEDGSAPAADLVGGVAGEALPTIRFPPKPRQPGMFAPASNDRAAHLAATRVVRLELLALSGGLRVRVSLAPRARSATGAAGPAAAVGTATAPAIASSPPLPLPAGDAGQPPPPGRRRRADASSRHPSQAQHQPPAPQPTPPPGPEPLPPPAPRGRSPSPTPRERLLLRDVGRLRLALSETASERRPAARNGLWLALLPAVTDLVAAFSMDAELAGSGRVCTEVFLLAQQVMRLYLFVYLLLLVSVSGCAPAFASCSRGR